MGGRTTAGAAAAASRGCRQVSGVEKGVVLETVVERAGVPLGAAEVCVEELRGAVADLSTTSTDYVQRKDIQHWKDI